MLEERQRRLEEKTAKETAAEERRKALEEERTLRMIELRERRKQKDAKIEQQLHEKEKERIVMAREKARDRQEVRSNFFKLSFNYIYFLANFCNECSSSSKCRRTAEENSFKTGRKQKKT